jgi:DNA-binding CsgD family transcriptional regulator
MNDLTPVDRAAFLAWREAQREAQDACAALTRRQRECIVLVAKGMTQREIATVLDMSPATVQSHMMSLKEGLGAATLYEAVAVATKAGLV